MRRAQRRFRPAAICALAGLGACTVPSYEMAQSQPSSTNTCTSDTQCSPGACVAGMCVLSYSKHVEAVILEVVPPASAHFGGGDSFIIDVDVAGGANPRDLTIPAYATIAGKVVVDPGSSCDEERGSDGSFRVHVTASRSGARPGLPAYSAEANAEMEGAGYKYRFSLPPGFYDLYATFGAGCRLPPILLRDQDFSSGAEYFWPTKVTSLQQVSGTVTFSKPETLAGWSVELIEPLGGKTISTSVVWGEPAFDFQSFLLNYVIFSDRKEVPLIKLSPPAGTVAPSVLWDLSVVDLDNDTKVGLDITQLKWSTTTVRARVVSASSGAGVTGASVSLRSTQLADAPDGLSATYQTTAVSGADGVLEANLVPGVYKVVVIPPESSSAVRQETWTIAATPVLQAGRTIQIEPALVVSGAVREPLTGSPLGNTLVVLWPWGASPTVLETLLGNSSVLPRSANGTTGSDGSFAIGMDPGTFLFAARTEEARGFPWVVRTGLTVNGEAAVGLGELKATYPLVLEGKLRDAWGPVQRALIRAFLPLAGDGVSAGKGGAMRGAMQIAETRSNESGQYRLLLPAELRP